MRTLYVGGGVCVHACVHVCVCVLGCVAVNVMWVSNLPSYIAGGCSYFI